MNVIYLPLEIQLWEMGIVTETLRNPELPRLAALATVEALGAVAITTKYNHRELTHQSLKVGRSIKWIARTTMRALGMNPYVWASVHTVHHATPDANLLPILETADYLETRANRPDIVDPPIPDLFSGLDPVAVLTPDEVRDIGESARQLVAGRYDAPASYSHEETARLLDPVTPRYLYDQRPSFFKRVVLRQKTPEPDTPAPRSLESLRSELCDAHSPALHPKGIVGILLDNVYLYTKSARHFRDNRNRQAHLRQAESDHIAEHQKWGNRALILGNIALAGTVLGAASPLAIPGVILAGYAMTGVMAGLLRTGGNITNGFGHGGEHSIRTFVRGLLFNDYAPVPWDNGQFASNTKSLGPLTLDEVGGQYVHHEFPERIAYSTKRGVRKFIEAPFGTILEFLANHNIGMSRGDNFGLQPGERRPDEPSEAVVRLVEARARTLGNKVLEQAAA